MAQPAERGKQGEWQAPLSYAVAGVAVLWALPKSASSLLVGFASGVAVVCLLLVRSPLPMHAGGDVCVTRACRPVQAHTWSRLFGPAAPPPEAPPPPELHCDEQPCAVPPTQPVQRGSAGSELAQCRGWLWLCSASQASLKPRTPESQNAAKRHVHATPRSRGECWSASWPRAPFVSLHPPSLCPSCPRFGVLSAGKLVLSVEPGSEAQVTLNLADCDVYCAPGTACLKHALRFAKPDAVIAALDASDPAGGDDRRWWRRLPLLIGAWRHLRCCLIGH